MIKSMTGFAEKRFDSRTITAKFIIRTLNHRFLDWSYRGAQIGEVENRLRAICKKKLYRGKVDVFLELSFLDPRGWELRINENILQEIFSSLEKFSSEGGKSINFSVDNLFSIPHVVELKRKNLGKGEAVFLERCFEKTLDEVLKARMKEGKEIAREIQIHIQNIKRVVTRVEKLAKKQPALIKEKLKNQLKELGNEAFLSEEKIAEEAAYYAQRYDMAEEVARLKCHLGYAKELVSLKAEEPVGKKLDFLAQELYREANTINSKSQDIEITKGSIAIKGAIESIRQQVQNLE
ncbi:MAG: YicC family protein [Candidatus Aminicenantes bacterium]|nr:MAG: YicC family protein [Candidatus Aminicenantes bacterium]